MFHGNKLLEPQPITFVEVQLFVFLLLLLAFLRLRLAVVGLGRHPLDLARRLLPFATLVQRRLGRLADQVVCLGLGQDGGALPLQKELDHGTKMETGRDF